MKDICGVKLKVGDRVISRLYDKIIIGKVEKLFPYGQIQLQQIGAKSPPYKTYLFVNAHLKIISAEIS